MSENKEHIRHIMLFNFRKGKNVSQTCKVICSVYGGDALDETTCRKWFTRFSEGNYDIKEISHSEKAVTAEMEKIKLVIQNDPHMTTREIAAALNVTSSTISRHLNKLGLVKRNDVWVSLESCDKTSTDFAVDTNK